MGASGDGGLVGQSAQVSPDAYERYHSQLNPSLPAYNTPAHQQYLANKAAAAAQAAAQEAAKIQNDKAWADYNSAITVRDQKIAEYKTTADNQKAAAIQTANTVPAPQAPETDSSSKVSQLLSASRKHRPGSFNVFGLLSSAIGRKTLLGD